jgi:hypothetical protein
MLSVVEGHKAVLAALSDFRIACDEDFRFEGLLFSLRPPDVNFDNDIDNGIGFGNEEEGIWEARIATMALINALTNCPEILEDRILLREEFTRRGLNELIVVSTFSHSLPQSLRKSHVKIGSAIYEAARRTIDTTQCIHRGKI